MLRPAYMQSSEIGKQDRGGMYQQEESEETRVEDLLDWFSMPGGESKSQESLGSVDSKPNEPEENSEGEVEPVGRGQNNQDSPAPKEPRKPREPRREHKKTEKFRDRGRRKTKAKKKVGREWDRNE
jgi:hypothetical protein